LIMLFHGVEPTGPTRPEPGRDDGSLRSIRSRRMPQPRRGAGRPRPPAIRSPRAGGRRSC